MAAGFREVNKAFVFQAVFLSYTALFYIIEPHDRFHLVKVHMHEVVFTVEAGSKPAAVIVIFKQHFIHIAIYPTNSKIECHAKIFFWNFGVKSAARKKSCFRLS